MMMDIDPDCGISPIGSRFGEACLLNEATGHGSRARHLRKDLPVTDLPPFDEADLFDEAGYLRLYPGVAAAMMQGLIDTAWNHYHYHGRHEGRQANDLDPDFYLAAYPEVEQDLGHKPSVAEAAPHYIGLGRARGYLPNARAPRAANPAAPNSPFGGFWTDQANALDLIQSRLDLGWIKRRDAAMLRTFALEGIVDLDREFDTDRARESAVIVGQAFTGMFPDLRFDSPASIAEPQPWRPELTEQHVAALDPHMVSSKLRDLLLDKAVTDFLSAIFCAPPKLTASRAFLRESSTPDRDAAWHAYTVPLQFVAATFALEDSDDGAALAWPGSHRLPDLLWAGQHLSLQEARRAGAMDLRPAIARREARVRASLHGQEPRRLKSSAGARTFRHANLIHAATAPEPPLQRRSLTAWYCPSYVTPCHMETTRARTHLHRGFAFSSGVYPALDPLD
jgi:hypothetical protein